MLAPTSSTIDTPRIVGHMAAMAGRSTCAMVRRQILAMAMRAPVLPAETTTSARPVFTASIAIHIEEVRRPARRAWLGLSSIRTATVVWSTSDAAASAGSRSSSGRIWASSPTSRNRVAGRSRRARAAPGTTTEGP